MKNVMGIIHHHKNERALQEITRHRCMASVPYGGNYRLIDFTLSNMVNSGICNVAVIADFNIRSLIEHLGRGKDWGLDKKNDGLFILPTASTQAANCRKVDLEDLFRNVDYLERSKEKYVVLSGSNIISSLDYKKVLRFHEEKEADVTLIYQSVSTPHPPERVHSEAVLLELDSDSRVTELLVGQPGWQSYNLAMDMYIFEKSLLMRVLHECLRDQQWDFIGSVLCKQTQGLKIYAYPYEGYLAIINSIPDYYYYHMDLLEPGTWRKLFYSCGPVYTKLKDGPSTKYYGTADVRNALVANGCMISGRVENSVLFRGVRIAKGAWVKNSIIMSEGDIGEDTLLDGVILDKNVCVQRGSKLTGDNKKPLVVGKRLVV